MSSHTPALHEHLSRLDDADRRARLGRPVAASATAAYCTRSERDNALIVGAFIDQRMVASGELIGLTDHRAIGGAETHIADMLLAVEHPYRGGGVGHGVITELVRRAAQRRMAVIRMTYPPSDPAMTRLAAGIGAIRCRIGDAIRAELCTGWLSESLVATCIDHAPGFRPISLH